MEKKSMPKPIKTEEGKYQCPEDMETYETEEDYEKHCKEKHMEK